MPLEMILSAHDSVSGLRLRGATALASPSSLLGAAVAALLLGIVQPAQAQLSKGCQLLLNRGLQVQGMVEWDDFFHLDTYSNANYNSINWIFTSNPSLGGTAPGFPWARWVSDPTNMPPLATEGDETPYLSQCIALQLGDEWNLGDDTVRTTLVNWFNSVHANWPNTLLYHNNYAGQAYDAVLGDFITRAQPDMLFFDQYPFLADYTTGTPIPGPFTSWYSELRRYRQWGINTGIPFGTYVQIFHSVEDYDQRIYRYPSPSELRLNTSAALAFNAKVLTGFTYNTGAAVLFDILPNGYSGDTYTNALYAEQTDINRRALNLGRALVCLKPVYDLHNPNDVNPPPGPASGETGFPDGTVTSMMILRGRTISGGVTNATPMPNSFVIDPEEQSNASNPQSLMYSWWEASKNDPYFNGWGVTNKAGSKNNGLPGDVFIAWFRPLDESFDGPTYSNEVYFLVVNGLSDTNGTASDCLQEIHMDFSFGSSGITAVVMPDPETGLLQTNTLSVVGTKRRLILDLNGGDAALFKFADGAPFVGYIQPQQAPRLSISTQAGAPAITLSQLTPGARYELQTTGSLPTGPWRTMTGVISTNSTYLYRDVPAASATFYRAVGRW